MSILAGLHRSSTSRPSVIYDTLELPRQHDRLTAVMRHSTWLVPGIPEAADDNAAVDAALAFSRRLRKAVSRQLESDD